MRKLRWLMAALLAVASTPLAMAAQQSGTVTGRVVTGESQQPLSGVQVIVAGTSRGSLTDQQGRYTIAAVPAGTHRIRASVLGYQQGDQPVTVAAGQTATVNFSLQPSALELTGIVVNPVTGQAERKRELGTNTAAISVDEIAKAPITKVADVLTGRTAGVTLQGTAGSVGTSQRIRIRGANSLSLDNDPLIYVDGIQFSNSKGGAFYTGGQDFSRLNDLNAEDIEKVEILKGPAASALYGTAAANGVILITTKKGRSGDAQWKAYVETGTMEDVNDYPDVFLAYQINDPNAPLTDASGNLNFNGRRANNPYVPCPNVFAATGSCRQDAVAQLDAARAPVFGPFQTGHLRSYGLSVSGGGEQVTYFLSADKDDQEGVISFNTQDKTNLRANLNARLTDKLDVQVNTGYVKSDLALNANDNNIFSPIINAVLATPFVPTQEQLDASRAGRRPGFGFGFTPADIEELITFQEVDRFLVGGNATYRPLPWLSANANVGLDFFSREDVQTLQPGRLPIAASFTAGFRGAQRGSNYLYTGSTSTTATFDVMDNVVSTSTAGATYNRQLFESTYCYGSGIVEGTRSCSAASSLFDIDEGFSEIITIGGFFRQQFAWNDRVFVSGSIRGDDNSAFGENFGFVWYPSASLSWVVAEEPWFPQTGFLSTLRLRTAYGTSGLRPNFRDAVTLFGPVAVTRAGRDESAVRLSRVGNAELKPERTTEYELGFDAGLFDDRLSVDFTYFNKRSEDALINRRLAPSFGLSGDDNTTGSIFDNLGSIRNSGTEAALNAKLIERDNFAFNARLSLTTLDNQIEELGEGVEPIVFGFSGSQRHAAGFPAGAFFGRKFTFNDEDGNGLLSRNEVRLVQNEAGRPDSAVFLGNALPTNSQSLGADVTLFGYITVATLFERRGGYRQYNFTEAFRCSSGFNRFNRGNCPGVADPNASLEEQARFIANRFLGAPTGYLEDADFVKWRELSVSLGVPPTLSRNLPFLEGASLTLSGRNLATWTDYSGLDPEINTSGGGSNFNQSEFNTQPPVRVFTARFNFNF